MKGKKPIYTLGFIIFTLGSVLCGVSANVYYLIGFRVLQAIGATMILALGMAIVTEAFPPRERGLALGITGSIVSIGIVIGPTLGGLLIYALSWHWIFFVNLPVGILGTWMVTRFVPAIKPTGEQHFDYWGALTLFISLLSVSLALTIGQQIGFSDPRIVILFLIWAVFLAAFVVIEFRAKQPMIDLHLFRNILFSINLVTGFITFVSIAGTIILMPFYLENVLGFNTQQVGLLLAVVPVAMGFVAPIAGSVSDRFGTRPITVVGLFTLGIGYYALSTLSVNTSTAGYLLRFLPIGIGMGVFQSPNNSAIMGTAPRERLGVVSGMLALTRTLGQTTGIAVLGAIWASRTFFHAGKKFLAGATAAPASAQTLALTDTFLGIVVIIFLALCLSIWGVYKERRMSAFAKPQTTTARASLDS
jgi:EmrB/QacA subfamily drug resistance transporter